MKIKYPTKDPTAITTCSYLTFPNCNETLPLKEGFRKPSLRQFRGKFSAVFIRSDKLPYFLVIDVFVCIALHSPGKKIISSHANNLTQYSMKGIKSLVGCSGKDWLTSTSFTG